MPARAASDCYHLRNRTKNCPGNGYGIVPTFSSEFRKKNVTNGVRLLILKGPKLRIAAHSAGAKLPHNAYDCFIHSLKDDEP